MSDEGVLGGFMIDFHTHTVFSDGELIPSELVRRAQVIGYRIIGITDHGDVSNIDFIIPRIRAVAEALNKHGMIRVIPGIELTHVPPADIGPLTRRARELGASLVVMHGESPVEPVCPGTNRAAIDAGVDILAHPGLISEEDARSAAKNGVALEITARKGHSLTNGHVARTALESGATLVINTDTHSPDNLITLEKAFLVLRGAGLTVEAAQEVLAANEALGSKLSARS
jgi:histidinol phosphatase-like PHP family hydrolase